MDEEIKITSDSFLKTSPCKKCHNIFHSGDFFCNDCLQSEQQKHKIIIKEWKYDCGEPRCWYDYGNKLIINGEVVDTHYDGNTITIEGILKALNIKNYEIEEIYLEEED